MARRGQPEGTGARDLSFRLAALLLALAACAACATSRVKVIEPLREPARKVFVTLDPTEGATRAELDDLARAIASPLIRNGVDVVPRAEPGALELLGHLSVYRPGVHLTVIWLALDGSGAPVGQCRTDYGVSVGLDAVDWGDVVQRTGAALAEFLAGS